MKRSGIGGGSVVLLVLFGLARIGAKQMDADRKAAARAAEATPSAQTVAAAPQSAQAPKILRPTASPAADAVVRALAAGPSYQLAPAAASSGSLTAEQLFAHASPSVVMVEVRDVQMRPVSQGTGFFISSDGLLVTNFHVIEGAAFASVRTADGQTLFVEGVVAKDEKADLALLKVRAAGRAVLRLAGGAAPRVGTRVFAIGNPQGLTNTLSEGLVSGHRDQIGGLLAGNAGAGPAVIQTSAAISPGSSGGPLMTADGAVVGVTSATLGSGQNLNFAVSTAVVRRLIDGRGRTEALASAAARPIDPADARAYAALFAALDDEQIRQAAAMLKTLSVTQKENPFFWFTAGCVHARLRNFELSAQAYDKAVQLRPDFAEAHSRLGDSLQAVLARDRGLDAYRRAPELNPPRTRGGASVGITRTPATRATRWTTSTRRSPTSRLPKLYCWKGTIYGMCAAARPRRWRRSRLR